MQLHKIKQYGIFDLSRILFFRLIYSARLTLRKFFVLLVKPRYQKVVTANTHKIYHKLTSSLFTYYGFISIDDEILKEAAILASGQTRVFGQLSPFNADKDWLKDPVSRMEWPQSLYWRNATFIVNGLSDVKFLLEINKLNDLVVFAKAYYYSKEEKYIQLIARYLDGWMSCVPLEKSVANKIAMDFGFRIINLIHVSLLCYESDYFKDVIHPQVMGIIKHHVNHLWKNLSSRWFKSGNDNNHNIGEIIGLYVGQIWLREFGLKVFLQKIEKELVYLKDVTERMIAPSGCYMEQSANYTRLVHDFFLMFELFRHALDYNRNFGWFDNSGYFDRISHYLLDISYHGQLLNFGDNDYARVVIPFEDKNDVVSHVRKHCHNKNIFEDYSVNGQWLYHSKDNNDIFIFSRVGQFSHYVEGAFIHAHNDLLAVLLYAKGKNVFIDKGTLYYNSGIGIRKEFTSTGSHNSIQIGDREMADFLPIGFKSYPFSSVKKSIKNDNSCLFEGEVSYKDITHTRLIEYNGKSITICDSVVKVNSKKEIGTLRFLLAEDIICNSVSDGIILKDSEEKDICKVSFVGIDSYVIKVSDYAPHYALRKQTNLIEAYFTTDNNRSIKTSITFL